VNDRKYRQRGYQDEPRGEPKKRPPAESTPRELRRPNMPGFRDVVRCARCGGPFSAAVALDTRCSRCGADLHTCAQCTHFDTSRPFECARPIQTRVSPKDERNACTLFDARVTVERETGSSGPPSARQAFDDLFR
jgi:hypothetical protein